MATVAASHLASLAALQVKKRLDRKKKTPWADRQKRPFLFWLESMKKSTGMSDDVVQKTLKVNAEMTLATWTGDTTLPDAERINNHIVLDFGYANFWMGWKLVHDEYKKHGFTILPNGAVQAVTERARRMTGAEFESFKHKIDEDLDSKEDAWEREMDLALHKQGNGSTDLPGLNALMPITNTGNFAGHDRTRMPVLQHIAFAGPSGAAAPSGITHIGPSATSGSSGNVLTKIRQIIREIRRYAAQSGLPSGDIVAFGGSGAIDKILATYEAKGLDFNRNANPKGEGGVDMVLLDEDLMVGRMPVIYDPTLDLMDSVAASEKGVGLGTATVGFSGGAVTDVILVDRGSGYTSAPTVAISGTGSGATAEAYWYGTGSGTREVTVDSDDKRIGKIAYVTVTAGGTGYTAGSNIDFTDRLYFFYKPSWELLHQDGLDKFMSIPADQPRKRLTEVHTDATYFLVQCLPRVNAVLHIT